MYFVSSNLYWSFDVLGCVLIPQIETPKNNEKAAMRQPRKAFFLILRTPSKFVFRFHV